MNPKFQGIVTALFKARVNACLASFEGKEMEVVIRKITKPASDLQRRYYHGVIVKMFAEFMSGIDTKETHAEAHDALRVKFLSVIDERGLTRIRSTEDLSTIEKEAYHVECRMLGDSLGFYIPLPNECEY